ncbi:MAG: hypothetical protein AAF754_07365 [Pseudomonadota bacterium]
MPAKIIALTVMLSTFATQIVAADFRSTTRMRVNVLTSTEFEVSGNARFGAQSYWCAAAQFARARLDLQMRDRLYVSKPLKRSGPVAFSTVKPDDANGGTFLTVTQTTGVVGGNMSVGKAGNYCGDESPGAIN